jgi:hypothetical protein
LLLLGETDRAQPRSFKSSGVFRPHGSATQFLERRRISNVVCDDGGTAGCLRLGMKRVLLSLCLIGAAVFPSATLPIAHSFDLEADDAPSKATLLSHPCLQTTERDEVHAVVVDMPEVISLSYASPDTWDDLPIPVRPYETSPAISLGQQLAMSLSD